jgi:diguanylate cyclase (GGDEF)-like protein
VSADSILMAKSLRASRARYKLRTRSAPLPVTVTRIDDEPVSVSINGREFDCDEDGQTIIPKACLKGFRVAEIPPDVAIKPVEAVEGHTIHITNDVAFCRSDDGTTIALVEEMFRRKFWDGETGLSPYVAALRSAIQEYQSASETDFEDDGDYIFLHYAIEIAPELDIEEAIRDVDEIIGAIETRAQQLVARRRDGLLGILDRGSFDVDLREALKATHGPLALLLLDIDHFKNVNDTYGHQLGDAVLRSVAQVLQEHCTGNEEPYRYGGEELAILAPAVTLEAGPRLAEAIRASVEKLIFEGQPDLKITISVGVAAAPPAVTPEELLKSADSALYAAKHSGRNCVRT